MPFPLASDSLAPVLAVVLHPRNNHIHQKVNVEGTLILLKYAGQTKSTAFGYTSSPSTVHDNVSDLVMTNESLPVLHGFAQTEIHSRTKGEAKEVDLAFNGRYNVPTCAVRPIQYRWTLRVPRAHEERKTEFLVRNNGNPSTSPQ
ncbi:MAG: hypothetical protein Q9213_001616 [Squamulea squamosa]